MTEYRSIPYSDIPHVLDIYAQGVRRGKSTFADTIPTAEQWDSSHLKACRIGAYEDGRLIAWCALSPTSSRDCYKGVAEISLYVHEGSRAKGVGTALMTRAIEESEKNGIWCLYGSIFSTNIASIKMSLANGFRIVGTRERIAKDIFGQWQDTTIVERRSKTVGID